MKKLFDPGKCVEMCVGVFDLYSLNVNDDGWLVFSLLSAKNGSNHSTPPKFERMSVMPSNVTTSLLGTATTNSTFLDLNTVWNTHSENDHNIPILNERCMANETTVDHACQLFEICVSNLTRLVEEVEEKLQLKSGGGNMRIRYDPVRLHHSWYEFVSIQVAFYGGIMLGTLFGAIMLFTCKLISDCVTMSGTDSDQRTRRKRSECL